MRSAQSIGASALPSPAGTVRERRPIAGAIPKGAGSPWSYWLLLAFLFLLYANLPLVVPAVAAVAPAQTIAIAALVAMFLEITVARRPLPLVFPESHLLLLFVAVAALTSFTALWMRHAVEATLVLLRFVLIYFVIVHAVSTWPRLRGVCRTLVLGGLIPAAAGAWTFANGQRVEGRAGWMGIFANPNDLAYALVLLVPLALALGLLARGFARLLFWGAGAAFVGTLFLTYSRSGLVALGVVLLLCMIRWTRPAVWIPGVGALFAAFAIAFAAFWGRAQGFEDILADATLLQRWETIRTGVAMFLDRPLDGVGLACSVIGWPLYSEPGVSTVGWLHSHNTIVQVLGETGLFGGLAFLGLVLFALLRARRLGRLWDAAANRPARSGMRRYRSRYREHFLLVSAVEISLWGFVVCGLAAGLVLSWFPYLLLGLVAAAARLSAPFPESRVAPAGPPRGGAR